MLDSDLKAVTIFAHRFSLAHRVHQQTATFFWIKWLFTYLLFPPRNIFIVNCLDFWYKKHALLSYYKFWYLHDFVYYCQGYNHRLGECGQGELQSLQISSSQCFLFVIPSTIVSDDSVQKALIILFSSCLSNIGGEKVLGLLGGLRDVEKLCGSSWKLDDALKNLRSQQKLGKTLKAF